jgi:hypothetical protein
MQNYTATIDEEMRIDEFYGRSAGRDVLNKKVSGRILTWSL